MRCAVARRAGEIEIGRDLNWSSCWSVSPPSWDPGVTATLFVRWRGCKTIKFNLLLNLLSYFSLCIFVCSAAVVKTYSCIAGLAATIIIRRFWQNAP